MIRYVKGNLLESDAQALVNTVNTVGVMGKGIALQFREAFPENYRIYRNACRDNKLHIGEMLIVEDSNAATGNKLIVNFPTKTHWRYPSDYSYIEEGLTALRKEITIRNIRSIAIPPLGSHNGGLDWTQVRQMIENSLSDIDCEILLYEPSNVIVERLKAERVKLTPARAMLLSMFGDMISYGEFISVFAAEKLVYFMQRFGAKELFKIDFKPYFYGPYSGGKIAHVLFHLNGSYIKGMAGMEVRPFEYIWLMGEASQEAEDFINENNDKSLKLICEKTKNFLRGYYSNYTLELLSSVDYLLENSQSLKGWANKDTAQVVNILEVELQKWSRRKEQMFKRAWVEHAVEHLREITF